MVVRRIGAGIPPSRLRFWQACFCVLAVLLALAAADAGLHRVHAQSGAQASGVNAQSGATAGENQSSTAETPPSGTAAPVSEAQPKPSNGNSGQQQREQAVANECADLLKMATDLKAEVDKTTKDELSIAVVRKAGDIEQFARKVRGDTRMTAGKD